MSRKNLGRWCWYSLLALGVFACTKDGEDPSATGGDNTPDVVVNSSASTIVGRMKVDPNSNDSFLKSVEITQAANGKVYFRSWVQQQTGGIIAREFEFSISDKTIGAHSYVGVPGKAVDSYYFLEGEPNNEYEALDKNAKAMYKNGAYWGPIEERLYPYYSAGGYDLLSDWLFDPTQKVMVQLNPYSELVVYNLSTRSVNYYAPKPFSPPAPIGITFRSDVVYDGAFALANPGHHRVIAATWAYRADIIGSTVKPSKAGDLMLMMTEASDTIKQKVNYNALVNATRLQIGDSIVTQKYDGHAIDYSSERGFVRACQDDNTVYVVFFNTAPTLSIFQYNKKTKKLSPMLQQNAALYKTIPFSTQLEFQKISGKNQLSGLADGGRVFRVDIDNATFTDLSPKGTNVGGYNSTMSTPVYYNGKYYVVAAVAADIKGNQQLTYYYNMVEVTAN